MSGIIRWSGLPKGYKGKPTIKNSLHEGTLYEPACMTPAALLADLYRQEFHSVTIIVRGGGKTTTVATISAPDEYGRRTTWLADEYQPKETA